MDRYANWFALHVTTGKEATAIKRLTDSGLEAFAPRRVMLEHSKGKWREAIKLMLPGYVFVQTGLSVRDYYTIKETPGVLAILGRPPTKLHPSEMRTLLNNRDWSLSTGHKNEDGTYTVDSGPLSGWENRIQSVDARRRRATVEIRIIDKTETIDLPFEVTNNPDADPADTSPESAEDDHTEADTTNPDDTQDSGAKPTE